MSSDKIKIAQKTSLELLKAFVDICNKYNLRYFVGGGTMLGAIRHKGFIPWDDDVDIDMPRKDFQRFLEISDEAVKEYPFYDVISFYKGNDFTIDVKFVDKRTEILVMDKYIPKKTYIGMDIVPIDGVPANSFVRTIHLFRLNIIKCFYKLSILKMGGVVTNKAKKGYRAWYKKMLVYAGTKFPVEKILKHKSWVKRFTKALMKYPYDDCRIVGTMQCEIREKNIFPIEWYGKGTKYQFEDIEVIGVDNYDAWLTQLYGDYMTLPDEKHRVSHNFETIDEDQPV